MKNHLTTLLERLIIDSNEIRMLIKKSRKVIV